ncbi:MAG TPA: hypothetical protein VHF06_19395 [Pseudonocardiaceae bacterium]|jgi:hypothetical protein|nr:hypothetical protein [Pseudonocardiaceae bacterium]
MRVTHVDDVALLCGLAGPGTGRRCVLDGSPPAYLVPNGTADLYAVPRTLGGPAADRRFLATVGPGAVVPGATVLGAWQLMLLPSAEVLPLNVDRLRGVGYAALAEPHRTPVPVPRTGSVIVAALARGLDATLAALADALRGGEPPAHSVAIAPGEIVSLSAGSAMTGAGGVVWLRVAGGHARRNGDPAAVFGSGEPALLAGRDWITVNDPATVEAVGTSDLLATGHLPAALDAHAALTLRRIADRR